MIYAKVDVELATHPRASAAGEAMATWTWALLFTRAHALDGFVPATSLRLSWVGEAASRRHMAKLVKVGLVEASTGPLGDGWTILRYAAKNNTAADVAARRAEARDRMATLRANRAARSHEPTTDVRANTVRTSGEVPGSGSGSGSDLLPGGPGGELPEPPPGQRLPACAGPEAVEAFAAGIADGLGSGARHEIPHDEYGRAWSKIQAATKAKAPPGDARAVLAWIRTEAAAWVRSTPPAEVKYTAGWRPAKWLDWLATRDAGGSTARFGARGVPMQAAVPDAPWSRDDQPELAWVPPTKTGGSAR